MAIKIGTCPDSWGIWFPQDEKQVSWQTCLDEMAKAGYNALELGPWGYLPTDAATLHQELATRDLELVSTTIMSDLTSQQNIDQVILPTVDQMARLLADFPETRTIILMDNTYSDLWTGELTSPKQLDDTTWRILSDGVRQIRDYARDRYGLTVYFHPHGETHVETEAQIERLLDEVDIDLCLDTGHHAFAGGDPVEFLRRHIDRVKYLHLKDCDSAIREQKDREGLSFAAAIDRGIMEEAGRGSVDFTAIRDILADHAFDGWAIVEQDMYPAPAGKPFPIAQRTLNYLNSIRFSD